MEEDCHLPNHDTCRYSAELQVKSLVVWLIGKRSPSLPPCFRKQGTPSSQQALSHTVILSPVEPNWKYYSYLMSYRHVKRSMYKTKRSTCPSSVFSILVNRRQLYSCPKPWNHFLHPKCSLEWFLSRFMVLLVLLRSEGASSRKPCFFLLWAECTVEQPTHTTVCTRLKTAIL